MSNSVFFPDRARRGRRRLMLLLLLSLGMVVAGLLLPAVTVSSFWFFEQDLSIWEGIQSFFDEGQTALGLLVLTVSVVFPVTKILLGLLLLSRDTHLGRRTDGVLALLVWLSKWSMTDVFVFALIVLVLNGQLLTSADIHGGVAVFAAGVLLSAFAVSQVRKRFAE